MTQDERTANGVAYGAFLAWLLQAETLAEVFEEANGAERFPEVFGAFKSLEADLSAACDAVNLALGDIANG